MLWLTSLRRWSFLTPVCDGDKKLNCYCPIWCQHPLGLMPFPYLSTVQTWCKIINLYRLIQLIASQLTGFPMTIKQIGLEFRNRLSAWKSTTVSKAILWTLSKSRSILKFAYQLANRYTKCTLPKCIDDTFFHDNYFDLAELWNEIQ